MTRLFTDYIVHATRICQSMFAHAATYSTGGGDQISLDVFLSPEFFQQNEGYQTTSEKVRESIQVLIEDMQGLDYHGSFIIDGNEYQIMDIIDDNDYEVTFSVRLVT